MMVEVQKVLGIWLAPKALMSCQPEGIASGIRLSGYLSAESAIQFSVCRQFPDTARIEINIVTWDVTPMSETETRPA